MPADGVDVLTLNKLRKDAVLGVRFFDEDAFDDLDLWDRAGATTSKGEPCAIVEALDPNGAGARAGMEENDIVASLNGHEDVSRDEVLSVFRNFAGRIVITVKRADGVSRGNQSDGLPPSILSTPMPRQPQPRASPVARAVVSSQRQPPHGDSSPSAKPAADAPASNSGPPITPRLMKSSIQLHKELKEVGETIQTISDRVEQALVVTRGTRNELRSCALSTRKNLESNPSLTRGTSKEAAPFSPSEKETVSLAATRAAGREAAVHEADNKLRTRLGRAPTPEELNTEVVAELYLQRRDRRRQVTANTPIVEALVELEETSTNGVQLLGEHETKLERILQQLHEVYGELGAHFWQRDAIVNTSNRSAVPRVDDEPTHQVLRLAAEREDTARYLSQQATKAARLEASTMQMNKAEVQRAARRRIDTNAQYYRNDRQGTTFHGWSKEELKLGADTAS